MKVFESAIRDVMMENLLCNNLNDWTDVLEDG